MVYILVSKQERQPKGKFCKLAKISAEQWTGREMRPNSPQTRSCCAFCRLDVIVTLPVPLMGDRGNGIRGAARAEVVVRRLWKKGSAGESRDSQVVTLWEAGVPSFHSSCNSTGWAELPAGSSLHFITVLPHGEGNAHCLRNSFRTPQKAQSPGKNVALDGHICIYPPFLSEHFLTVCLLLITDWEFSKTDQQCSSRSGRSWLILFPLWTVHLLFLLLISSI